MQKVGKQKRFRALCENDAFSVFNKHKLGEIEWHRNELLSTVQPTARQRKLEGQTGTQTHAASEATAEPEPEPEPAPENIAFLVAMRSLSRIRVMFPDLTALEQRQLVHDLQLFITERVGKPPS